MKNLKYFSDGNSVLSLPRCVNGNQQNSKEILKNAERLPCKGANIPFRDGSDSLKCPAL